MPKPTKLHNKGKPDKLAKSSKVDDGTQSMDPEESVREFQLQLCWCIQQLERTLAEKKGNEKQLQETWKVLTVLKNNNQPTIRKRQLMRTHFGDYRAKMAAEEKKLAKMANKIKISDSPVQPKATFLRKSAFLSTGDNSFRFNFDLASDQIDSDKSEIRNNLDNSNANASINKNSSNSKTLETVVHNKFKFAFSASDFKFNFNLDDKE